MVKQRRASKRLTTAHRAKVTRKVHEHHRRSSSKSKPGRRKDPGIPKELPFRDAVIAEAMAARASSKVKRSALTANKGSDTDLCPMYTSMSVEGSLCNDSNLKPASEPPHAKTNIRKNGSKRISDPVEAVRKEIWGQISPDSLQAHYGLVGSMAPDSPEAFLRALARSTGRMRKGGIPDLPAAARNVLEDASSGKLRLTGLVGKSNPICARKDGSDGIKGDIGTADGISSTVTTTAVLSTLSPEFKIE